LEQQQEEAEAQIEEESCTEEEHEWYRNYMTMLVTDVCVPQEKETTIETLYQEDEEAENYKQNSIIRSP